VQSSFFVTRLLLCATPCFCRAGLFCESLPPVVLDLAAQALRLLVGHGELIGSCVAGALSVAAYLSRQRQQYFGIESTLEYLELVAALAMWCSHGYCTWVLPQGRTRKGLDLIVCDK
jgi:hypothetical protein